MTRLINNEVHALLFDTVMTNGYYTHLTVRVVARDGATLHNPARESAFDDLEFSCQMDKDTVEERRTYGWNVRYRAPFTVELVDAERMAKALRRIAKIQEKFPIRPTTFGQWVALTAQGLGIETAAKYLTHKGGFYTDNEYRFFVDMRETQGAIDTTIEAYFDEMAKVEQIA